MYAEIDSKFVRQKLMQEHVLCVHSDSDSDLKVATQGYSNSSCNL